MKPSTTEAAQVQSNITGDTGQFTIDEQSLAHIMSVLTNLYADPEMAVIREYLTNAYDSHIDAGTTRPIEVTTPSHFAKSYVIKDYGLGMSSDDLKTIYSKYGASTKRDSNTTVGMLGLGSKSALTYTNAFTITAVKNGILTKAIISVNEEGVPVFHIVVDNQPTDEPNGVEINIPVKDRNTFAEKTKNFVKFWPDNTVLVDGAEPVKHGFEHITDAHLGYDSDDPTLALEAKVFLAPKVSDYYNTVPESYIVMGNVAYKVDAEYIPKDMNALRVGFVAYVPIGSINITPSREKLHFTTKTKTVINAIGNGLAAKVIANKQKEIDAAKSYKDAWTIINNISYEMRNTSTFRNGVSYKGEKFIQQASLPYKRINWDYNGRTTESMLGSYSLANAMHSDPPLFIVTGKKIDYTKQKQISSQMRRKARYFAQQNGYVDNEIIFVDEMPKTPWLSHIIPVNFDIIEAIKVPRGPAANARPAAVPYEVYRYVAAKPTQVNKSGTTQATPETVTIDNEQVVTSARKTYYISPADMAETRFKHGTNASGLLRRFQDEGIELVVMGSNRFDKFLRTHPSAEHIKNYAQEFINNKAKSISETHLIADKFDGEEGAFCDVADYRAIDDPELSAFIRDYRTNYNVKAMDELQSLTNYLRRASIDVVVPEATTDKDPFVNYPLIKYVGGDYVEHLYTYINAKFAE